MTLNEKEEYELTIKNMQSKIDWLRDQRKLMDTYGKKYKPLMVDDKGWFWLSENECIHVDLIRKVEAAHGIN